MSSQKKKRKLSAQHKKESAATPPRSRDGDRRRRLGPLARLAIGRERQIHDWTIDSDTPMMLPDLEPPA